jgi:hypothetical protein
MKSVTNSGARTPREGGMGGVSGLKTPLPLGAKTPGSTTVVCVMFWKFQQAYLDVWWSTLIVSSISDML